MDEEIITEDELVAALFAAQARKEPSGALTTRALAKMVERRREWVREKLRDLIDEGRVEKVDIQIVTIAGRVTTTSAYKLVDDESSGTTV